MSKYNYRTKNETDVLYVDELCSTHTLVINADRLELKRVNKSSQSVWLQLAK